MVRAARSRPAALLGAALLVLATTASLSAQATARDYGLTVTPREGYVTLSWQPVAGADAYEIARSDDGGEMTVVGVWRPNRQVNQGAPSFADAGFVAGRSYSWRVRAVNGESSQPWSDAVVAVTHHAPGPEAFHTEFEAADGATFTSHEAELEWTRRLVEASPRVRVERIGRTIEGRDINLFIIGLPAPLATAAEISASPSVGANCNIHGNEPSGREGCFMMIRDLAFSEEAWVLDVLANATVLIVPSINGDGRAANTRGNAAGQDLNRDHARLTQPETLAFAAFLRDYTPEVMVDGHEYGNANTCDLPLLWPRHSNTAPTVHHESKTGFIEGWFYTEGAADGWWACPYPPRGIDGAQTFSRVSGLKNMVVTLVEARGQGGPTRPAEEEQAENRRRKAYSQLWAIRQALAYHRANLPAVQQAIAEGRAFQASNTGPVVFHGDWDVAAFPAPHPGDSPPPPNPPGPEQMLDPAPCAYFIDRELFHRPLEDSERLPAHLRTSVGQRLAAHGIHVEERDDGYLVPMTQPLRGLINIVLDPDTPPSPIVPAERVFDCVG